jgi:hypothetical protein
VRLPADTRLDPDSAGLAGDLTRQVQTYGTWMNSSEFSVPIYTVPADQPRVSVYIDNHHDMWTNQADATGLAQTLHDVPIPPGARPAAGTDQHMVIWQPSTDTMWELWLARNPSEGGTSTWRDNSPGWHAAWGAKIENASHSSGVIPAPYGATASGLALAGGLITHEDLAAGRIDHALAMAIPAPMAGRFVPPATRTDGKYTGEHAIPEGTRFRLPAGLDIGSLGLPPVTRMIAKAAQQHGIIVRDYAGAVAFYAEDPIPSSNFILKRLLNGQSPAQALSRFPWRELQVVANDEVLPPGDPADPGEPTDPVDPDGSGDGAITDPVEATGPAPGPVFDPSATPTSPERTAPDPAGPGAPDVPPVTARIRPSVSVARRQRIRRVLRHGLRVRCRNTAAGRCRARVSARGRVIFRGSRGFSRHGEARVTARTTRVGRRLLKRVRRQRATLRVTLPGGRRLVRRLTLVR